MAIAPDKLGLGARGEALRVRGLVQGVGFRPTVWRLARAAGLTGEVRNDSQGVLIHIWGDAPARAIFRARLVEQPPPLARIDTIESEPLHDLSPVGDFCIASSAGGAIHTAIVADAATCASCCAEVFDAAARRHGYAFTNCTHCGPRLSIVRAIPYDRAHTSMAAFSMCPRCNAEYESPADRRFHAQPNACPECGPRLWLEAASGSGIDIGGEPIAATRRALGQGYIIAIKGLGGVHLAVDATNADAVAGLRARKRRFRKPLALMARDIDMIGDYCAVSPAQADLLQSPQAPIVLLGAGGRESLAPGIAPGQNTYGFMLAYTPLHHLLLAGLKAPIVLTSGNRGGEPQCIGNVEARARLADIADALLLHDRDIVNRVDDSVVRVIAGAPALVRRARGYAPAPLCLPKDFADAAPVLAYGGELKNTFCLLRDGQAIVSQHIGDMENAAAYAAYGRTQDLYLSLFEHRPRVLAVDAHPDYQASQLGRERALAECLPVEAVAHHHAHIAACLADNNVALAAPPVLGIALDGTGYGDDGTIWGGEFLLADYRGYRRLAALAPMAMPGGAQAVRQPWRMAYAHLRRCFDWAALQTELSDHAFFQWLADKPLAVLDAMIEAGFNSPQTSSAGRLFDAVAAVLGLCPVADYEGQAAIELEAAADPRALVDGRAYRFAIEACQELCLLAPRPMWQSLVADLRAGVPAGAIAARFHAGLADGLAAMVAHLRRAEAIAPRVALSGGVFQNAMLTEQLIARLAAHDIEVLRHKRVPANDGGLSLGQAAIAAARDLQTKEYGRTRSCA